MLIKQLKSLVLIMVLIGLFPDLSHSVTSAPKEPDLMMDKACVTSGMDNLKRRYSYLSADDIKNITIYGCFCAYKEAQRTSLPPVGRDFRNATDCVFYAVVRNAMRGGNTAASIESRCLASYPRDLTDDSANDDVASFCHCASVPVSTINVDNTIKFTEDQLYEKIILITKGCR